jgi:hypothetical protein
LVLGDVRKRSAFSTAKLPFLRAVRAILEELKPFWPVSDRKIHYKLVELPDPPLRHANKPETWIIQKGKKKGEVGYNRYRNDRESYKSVIDLLARGRLIGVIPWEAIADETRPVVTWDVYPNAGAFIRKQLDEFGEGYSRDLMQGQTSHIEIIGEKLTLENVVRPVAMKYCIPYTIGRGYASLPPRRALSERYKKSGKKRLALLFLSDHDPEGWDIAESFGRSMRDDFGVRDILAFKVGLTPEQVRQLGLPDNKNVKVRSSRYRKYKARFGAAVYELEAVSDPLLQEWLEQGVRSVLDVRRFNAEVRAEEEDQVAVEEFRQASLKYLERLRPE